MRRDREQGLCELADRWDQEVLDILAGEDDGRVLFAYTLHGVADVFDRGHVRQEQVQLVDGRRCVALAEQLIAHALALSPKKF